MTSLPEKEVFNPVNAHFQSISPALYYPWSKPVSAQCKSYSILKRDSLLSQCLVPLMWSIAY